MNKRKKLLCYLVGAALVTSFPIGWSVASASEATDEKETIEVTQPIIVDSRDLSYNNVSGNVFASGDVSIQQGTITIQSEEIQGNAKDGIFMSDHEVRFIDSMQQADLIGYNVWYDTHKKVGSMDNVRGTLGEDVVTGESVKMSNMTTVIHNGTTTTCTAKNPDYHIEAAEVIMMPDGTRITKDATLFIKGKPFYHTKEEVTHPGEESIIPHPGFNSDNGFYIKQRLEYPVFMDGMSAFSNIGIYSNDGFKAYGGLKYKWNGQEVRVITGEVEDDDDEWINKKIEYQWQLFDRRIGHSKFHYKMNASYGLWSGEGKKSWHEDYNIYFSHDPINITEALSLSLGAGYQVIRESYDDSTNSGVNYDAVLTNQFSPKFKMWTGYHYRHVADDYLFDFYSPDMEREWRSGARYSWNMKDAISFRVRYDIDRDRVYDRYYTFEKDLHCFRINFTYRELEERFTIDFISDLW